MPLYGIARVSCKAELSVLQGICMKQFGQDTELLELNY